MRDYEQGKDSLVVAQFIARFIFKEKRCYELRDYEQGKDSLVVAQFIARSYIQRKEVL